MAEGEELRERSEESVKLFVGQVPKSMTEDQLLTMFQEFAHVDQVNLIKDKITRASRGCCFVICPSREEADKAVDACHNKTTLPGVVYRMEAAMTYEMIPVDVVILSCDQDYELCAPFLNIAAVYSSELLLNGIIIQKLEFERHRLFKNHHRRNNSRIGLKKDGDRSLPVAMC